MSLSLCQFKDIIGKPNTGFRKKYRIWDIAVIDTVVTALGGVAISLYFRVALWKALLGVFLLGVVSHRLFCVRTGLDKKLFP